jgi:hypothetical protein
MNVAKIFINTTIVVRISNTTSSTEKKTSLGYNPGRPWLNKWEKNLKLQTLSL